MKSAAVPIRELVTVVGGGTPRKSVSDYFGGSIPWVTPKDMKQPLIVSSEVSLTEEGVRQSPAKLIPEGSVLVVVRSGVLKHTLPVALTTLPVTVNQDMKALVPKGSVHAPYLARLIKALQPQVLRWVRATTADNFPIDNLLDFEVEVPSIDEQRRIAEILSKADQMRVTQRRAARLSEEVLLARFEEIRISAPCRTMKLSDACWFQEGPGVRKWQFTNEGVKLLNVGNILTGGRLDLRKTDRYVSSDEAYGKYKHFLADAGDLVIASSGITFGIDGLLSTRAAFVNAEHLPLCMNTSTIRFKANPEVSDLSFLKAWFSSIEFRSQITRLVTGSAQQNFGPSHLRQLAITLPNMQIQRAFADHGRCLEDLRGRQLNVLRHCDDLFASLEARAFSGQL